MVGVDFTIDPGDFDPDSDSDPDPEAPIASN
jgi:hypothetical protein